MFLLAINYYTLMASVLEVKQLYKIHVLDREKYYLNHPLFSVNEQNIILPQKSKFERPKIQLPLVGVNYAIELVSHNANSQTS